MNRENYIGDLAVGEAGFCVPWSVSRLSDGRAFVRLDYAVTSSPEGSSQAAIVRLQSGYAVILKDDEYSVGSESETNHFQRVGLLAPCSVYLTKES